MDTDGCVVWGGDVSPSKSSLGTHGIFGTDWKDDGVLKWSKSALIHVRISSVYIT